MGHKGKVEYSPQSPDLTPLDFNLQDSLKNPAGPEKKIGSSHATIPLQQYKKYTTMLYDVINTALVLEVGISHM
jgi:hypothetical protein